MDSVTEIHPHQLATLWAPETYQGPPQDLSAWTGDDFRSEAPSRPMSEEAKTSPEEYIRRLMGTESDPAKLVLKLLMGFLEYPQEEALVVRLYKEKVGIYPGWNGLLNDCPSGVKAKLLDLVQAMRLHDLNSLEIAFLQPDVTNEKKAEILAVLFEHVQTVASASETHGYALCDSLHKLAASVGRDMGGSFTLASPDALDPIETRLQQLQSWFDKFTSRPTYDEGYPYSEPEKYACTRHPLPVGVLPRSVVNLKKERDTATTFLGWFVPTLLLVLSGKLDADKIAPEGKFQQEWDEFSQALSEELFDTDDHASKAASILHMTKDNHVARAVVLEMFLSKIEEETEGAIDTFNTAGNKAIAMGKFYLDLHTNMDHLLTVCYQFIDTTAPSQQALTTLDALGLGGCTRRLWDHFKEKAIPGFSALTALCPEILAKAAGKTKDTFSDAPPLVQARMLCYVVPLSRALTLELIATTDETKLTNTGGQLSGQDGTFKVGNPRRAVFNAALAMAREGFLGPLQAILSRISVTITQKSQTNMFRVSSTPVSSPQVCATQEQFESLIQTSRAAIEPEYKVFLPHCHTQAQEVKAIILKGMKLQTVE